MSKIALVTGASSGIGAITARELSKAGFIVYAAARRVNKMEDLKKTSYTLSCRFYGKTYGAYAKNIWWSRLRLGYQKFQLKEGETLRHFPLDKNYAVLLKSYGISVDELLKKAKLPLDIFVRNNPCVTSKEYYRFIESLLFYSIENYL